MRLHIRLSDYPVVSFKKLQDVGITFYWSIGRLEVYNRPCINIYYVTWRPKQILKHYNIPRLYHNVKSSRASESVQSAAGFTGAPPLQSCIYKIATAHNLNFRGYCNTRSFLAIASL